MIAYHFVGNTLRDGRPVPKDGEVLRHNGPLELCVSGLHASVRPWHALQYAPGPVLCRVECGGTIVHSHDKLVCTERTILRRMDATELLLYIARMQAVSVLHLWQKCPPNVVLDYLMTGDESLRKAARVAAKSAAKSAAEPATRAAMRYAGNPAEIAAWAAAMSAAWAAAMSAAWATAEVATDAARSATMARYVARAATENAIEREFDALVEEYFA